MQSKIYLRLIVLALLMMASQNVSADGFPVRPGRLLVSTSYSYFYADQLWDQAGVKHAFPNSGSFSSQSVYLYVEYGLSKRLTIVTSIPYMYVQSKSTYGTTSASGLGDAETGLRYYLFNIAYRFYFSLKASVTTPLYTGYTLGYNQPAGELKLAVAGTGKIFGDYYYFDVANGVRQFFDNNGPIQDRYNGTFGLALDSKSKNQLVFAVNGAYSESNFKAFSSNLVTNRDYRFTQGSVGYGHTFASRYTLLFFGNKFITGRNTGDGYGGTVSLIYRLDNK